MSLLAVDYLYVDFDSSYSLFQNDSLRGLTGTSKVFQIWSHYDDK